MQNTVSFQPHILGFFYCVLYPCSQSYFEGGECDCAVSFEVYTESIKCSVKHVFVHVHLY